ncbi:hypothetical protein PIB30_101473, partial [Stylosanthes scabra]|nr:hypothetical protein [Stylosanthes scabra]
MSEGERIEDALERLSKIFNSLSMLGRTYPEQHIVRGESKKKSLALKASNSHSDNEEEEDQDFQLLIKKFTKFAKRENLIPKKQNKSSKCFECGEIGHIKLNCPKLQKGEKYKKLKKKQKTYMSWKNEDDSSTDSDDDEVANICLMANDEKVFPSRRANSMIFIKSKKIKEPTSNIHIFAKLRGK